MATNDHAICWINSIGYEDAAPELQAIYDEVKSPSGHLDNLYRAFSLRAHTIKPADDLYLAALHNFRMFQRFNYCTILYLP